MDVGKWLGVEDTWGTCVCLGWGEKKEQEGLHSICLVVLMKVAKIWGFCRRVDITVNIWAREVTGRGGSGL